MRYSQDEIRRFAKEEVTTKCWAQRHNWSQNSAQSLETSKETIADAQRNCQQQSPQGGCSSSAGEKEREILFSSTARRAKTAARDGLSRDNIFSGGRPEKQTDRRSSTSLQPNDLASQQPIYMTLFMDVIGFESWSLPLGGILSESGAFAQLAQGMAPFLEGQFWHCVGI